MGKPFIRETEKKEVLFVLFIGYFFLSANNLSKQHFFEGSYEFLRKGIECLKRERSKTSGHCV